MSAHLSRAFFSVVNSISIHLPEAKCMNVTIKSTFKERSFCRDLLSASLLFVLFFSCISIVNAADSDGAIHVGTEAELVAAVCSATFGARVVIALDKDISLSGPLSISIYQDITLVSAGVVMSKLIGAYGQSTIYVTGGMLRLGNIVVTHENGGPSGFGVVIFNGTLIMSDGEISGNTAYGVYNSGGNFTMLGGKIFNNRDSGVYTCTSFTMSGGEIFSNIGNGVTNDNFSVFNLLGGKIFSNDGYGASNSGGIFSMSGGEIFGNSPAYGGGVSNSGFFDMWGGKIFNNTPLYSSGGGVSNIGGGFSMSGGEIFGNSATSGGGVCITGGNFSLTGGLISNNTAAIGGGVYIDVFAGSVAVMTGGEISYNSAGSGGGVYIANKNFDFVMINGTISSNVATNDYGGGVYNNGNFDMRYGVISNNKATSDGGGIYNTGTFNTSGGVISNNNAGVNGGGIGVPELSYLDNVYISDGVTFSGNIASISYNRDSVHNELYNSHIGSSVTWTTPFTQGYNNYDISYTSNSPVNSPKPSEPQYSPKPSSTSLNVNKEYLMWGGMMLIVGVAIILAVISTVIILVMFVFSKKIPKQ
jgi:hypothetical protein